MNYKKKLTIAFSILLLSFNLSKANAQTEECFEGISRGIFKFNMAFDDIILEPVAKGFHKLPRPIKAGTSNFTSNISTLLSIPNSLLQGNLKEFVNSTGSFLVNSTVGILGFLNPAEKIGLKPHKEDVGQTLATYGVGSGCYFVLPILGPTTVRDTLGLLADTYIDPFAHVTIREHRLAGISGNDLDFYTVKSATAVDFRADNLTNFTSLEKNSLDLYSSYKSLYLQNRKNKIKNSNDDQEDWGSLDN